MRIETSPTLPRPVGLALALALVAFGATPALAQVAPPPPPATAPTSPGLMPPAPTPVPQGEQATYRQLEQADREDAGRGLQFVWLAPDVGFQWLSFDALSGDDLGDDRLGAGSGLAFGATAGVRWLYYTLGARFRYGLLDEFTAWSLGGDVGLRIPLGSFEPYFVVGGGYLSASDFAANDELRALGATSDLAVSGVAARLGGGFDYYLTPVFSTGVSLDAEALFVSRDAVARGTDTVYDVDGSGVGLAFTSLAVLGLHF